jgi:SulP family sulfate permease
MCAMHRNTLERWLPFLAWPRPSADLLRGELLAGLTVGLMLIPQAVAYAALAGMPLVTGIYASLVPALVAVLFSSSTRLGVGPTALTSLLIGASLTGLAEPGSAQWITMAIWIAILSGLMQILIGLMRWGWLLNLVTSPVLNGFTQAAALLILGSQLGALLGLKVPWQAVWSQPSWSQWDWIGTAMGMGSLAALMVARRFKPLFPSAMVVIGITGLMSWACGYAQAGGAIVGSLPSSLPQLVWPAALSGSQFLSLLAPAMVVTLVSFLETASSAKADSQRTGTHWNENQDLIGQGLAKISSGLCGSFATSASFSRSALNVYAGAKSGWATIFSIGVVLLVLLWLTPALYHVPKSVLAAVVVVAVINLVQPGSLLKLWRVSKAETCVAGITFALTLVTAPRMYWGVLAGLWMTLCLFLYQRLHPRIIELGLHPDGTLRDRHLWQLPSLGPNVLALRMDAALDFASAAALERRIIEDMQTQTDTRHVCLMAQSINRIDVTGVEMLGRLLQRMQQRQGTLHLCGLKLPVEEVLQRAGVLSSSAHLATYRTEAEALAALQHTGINDTSARSASPLG